jgi:hypothetical protein
MPHHLTLCSSICVPVVVFQQSCFSICPVHASNSRVSAFVSNSRDSASTFQHVSLLCCSICVRIPTVVFQHLVFTSNSRVSASTFQHVFTFVLQHLFATNIRVSASVVQQSCFSIYVSALVLQHLCSYKQS